MNKELRLQRPEKAIPDGVRGAGRLSVQCPVTYSGASGESVFISEGTMIDLSESGWGLCGEQPVYPGMVLTLWVHHPDEEEPIMIDEVSVAWVSGNRFGVRSIRHSLSTVC